MIEAPEFVDTSEYASSPGSPNQQATVESADDQHGAPQTEEMEETEQGEEQRPERASTSASSSPMKALKRISPRWSSLVSLFGGRRKSATAAEGNNEESQAIAIQKQRRRITDPTLPLPRNPEIGAYPPRPTVEDDNGSTDDAAVNSADVWSTEYGSNRRSTNRNIPFDRYSYTTSPTHSTAEDEDDEVAVASHTPRPYANPFLPQRNPRVARPPPEQLPHHIIVERNRPVRDVLSNNHPLTGYAVVQPDVFTPEIVQRGGFGNTNSSGSSTPTITAATASRAPATNKSGYFLYRQDSVIDRENDPWPIYWRSAQGEQFKLKSEVELFAERKGFI
jgi:hypothetical protein